MRFNGNTKSYLNVSVLVEKASLTKRYKLPKPGVLRVYRVYANMCHDLPRDTYRSGVTFISSFKIHLLKLIMYFQMQSSKE